MGKIRTKIIGDETAEKEQKKQAKKRQEAKIMKGDSLRKQGISLNNPPTGEESKGISLNTKEETPRDTRGTRDTSKRKKASHSRHYQTIAKLVDRNKIYPLNEALKLLPKLHLSKFDETVELHINTTEAGITGALTLPHGTGKKTRVAIADDKIIADIEKGKIDFDVLLAQPQMMPKLAKAAKILGPRGLMPNPKNGTIAQNPEEIAKKYEGGQVRFKTEAKTPIIHLSVGKLSFGDKKLLENIKEVFMVVPKVKVKNATLKSTMSPGIKIAL